MSDDVLYEEAEGIAIVAINRPEKKNTLTERVIRGIADGVDAAARSKEVAAVVLRGVGDTFAAGYDLTDGGDWDVPYGAPELERREGGVGPGPGPRLHGQQRQAFHADLGVPEAGPGGDPGLGDRRRDRPRAMLRPALHGERRAYRLRPSRIYGAPTTMLWVYRLGLEHAKQFLLTGRAIDAGTAHRIGLVAHVAPPGELAGLLEADARRFRHIPANQLALNKLLINQAFENMGLRTTQLLGTLFDGISRHTEEAYRWAESFSDKGFREVIRERDAPWQDYGERPKPKDD